MPVVLEVSDSDADEDATVAADSSAAAAAGASSSSASVIIPKKRPRRADPVIEDAPEEDSWVAERGASASEASSAAPEEDFNRVADRWAAEADYMKASVIRQRNNVPLLFLGCIEDLPVLQPSFAIACLDYMPDDYWRQSATEMVQLTLGCMRHKKFVRIVFNILSPTIVRNIGHAPSFRRQWRSVFSRAAEALKRGRVVLFFASGASIGLPTRWRFS